MAIAGKKQSFVLKKRRAILITLLLSAGIIAAAKSPSPAAIPDLSPAALTAEADLILTGRLVATTVTKKVPEWVKKLDNISSLEKSAFVDEVFTLSIQVRTVEKGARKLAGKTIEAHGWRVDSRPSGWAGPGGTIGDMPANGARIKVWLKQDEGRWQLISPSGLVLAR